MIGVRLDQLREQPLGFLEQPSCRFEVALVADDSREVVERDRQMRLEVEIERFQVHQLSANRDGAQVVFLSAA